MDPSSDVAFSPAVKAVQERRGSRAQQARRSRWPTAITPDLADFLARATTAYLATASADGQPYVQHRGGPPGFLVALDARTIGFADYAGNRQYVTTGNLAENPRAMLFVMDYEQRRRIKIWGEARIVEDDPALTLRLFPTGYRARPQQAVLMTVKAWDVNCSQHIPQMFPAAEVVAALDTLEARVRALEEENAALRAGRAA
ncbi:MAG: pyridoxamine 5'-phosphate oxidase family protein [Alphaproteobacteria bacterium]|nr:pyridoxamine 5'-phosphate oxidase family protein [Alphaproteobacteria bacterium]